ncbi:MAG: hypothetical protein ACOC22_01680 [bacterium]
MKNKEIYKYEYYIDARWLGPIKIYKHVIEKPKTVENNIKEEKEAIEFPEHLGNKINELV